MISFNHQDWHNLSDESQALLMRLHSSIQEWASNEDGVPDFMWDDFLSLSNLICPSGTQWCHVCNNWSCEDNITNREER